MHKKQITLSGLGRVILCNLFKNAKIPEKNPRNCGIYSLTKTALHGIIVVHTVILCLFLESTLDMVILPQFQAAVKWELEQN